MSSLGPSGSNNPHAALNFSQAGLRRSAGFPPAHPNQHQHQPNKQSPAPHTASPYQPQGYTPQQPPGSYPPHLFASPVSPNIPNGHASSRTQNPHIPPSALGVQQRRAAAPSRQQMPPQPNPPPMMFPGSMSQSVQHDPILSHQHQQQQQQHPSHPSHPSHQGHQGHQGHQAHQAHQGHPGHPSHQQHPSLSQQQSHHQQHPGHPAHQQHPQHVPHPAHHGLPAHTGHPGRQSVQPHQPHGRSQQPTPQQQPQQPSQQQQQPQQQQPQAQITPQSTPQQSTPQPPQQQAPQQQQLQQHQQHQHPHQQQQQHQQQHQQQQQQQQHQQQQHQQQQQQQPPQPQQVQQVQQASQVQASPQQPAANIPQQENSHASDEMDVDIHQDGDAEVNGIESKLLSPSYIPSQPMGEMMSPPPEGGSYPTLEAVQKAVLRYCTSVGYAIVIGRSKKTVPGLKKVLFVCDRAGKPPSRVSPESRKRKTSSRKCDCPFGFFAIEQRTQWTIRYRPDPAHLQHNHGPSESPSNHPAARKLDSKMVAAVKQLKENGAGVTETLSILQNENPDCHLLPRDIYNARAAINRNPQKVATGLAENRPAIYTKPQQSPEDRIRADLRRELAKARSDLEKFEEEKQKEIDALKAQLAEKEKLIKRFEMFIDICNERVMVQRERLAGTDGAPALGGNPGV